MNSISFFSFSPIIEGLGRFVVIMQAKLIEKKEQKDQEDPNIK